MLPCWFNFSVLSCWARRRSWFFFPPKRHRVVINILPSHGSFSFWMPSSSTWNNAVSPVSRHVQPFLSETKNANKKSQMSEKIHSIYSTTSPEVPEEINPANTNTWLSSLPWASGPDGLAGELIPRCIPSPRRVVKKRRISPTISIYLSVA